MDENRDEQPTAPEADDSGETWPVPGLRLEQEQILALLAD